MLGQVEPAMQRRYEGNLLAGKQRERIVVQMEMNEVERIRLLAYALEHQHVQRVRVPHRAVEAQRPRPWRFEPCRSAGVAAGKQCDVMSECNQFLGQPMNDPFGASLQLWRDRFGQRRNLSDVHCAISCRFGPTRSWLIKANKKQSIRARQGTYFC
jgi:hypothetical protein